VIRRRVSAVFALRDALSGAALGHSDVMLSADDLPTPFVCKEGGLFALTDLSPGDHNLSLTGAAYRAARVPFAVSENEIITSVFSLLPTWWPPRDARRIDIGGARYALFDQPSTLRLARAIESEQTAAQVIPTGNMAEVAFPAEYIIVIDGCAERVEIASLSGGAATLLAPIKNHYARGAQLFRCAREE
jgi:hypothetical protein